MYIRRLLFGICFISAAIVAQAQQFPSDPNMIRQVMERPSMFADQAILEVVPLVPPDYQQYIFPAFHEIPALSHRMRTMPEIAKWKGKVPTRIAPELQGKGPYGWRYLSPSLYIYLMPELWPSYYAENELPKSEITLQINWQNPEEVDKAFNSFQKTNKAWEALHEEAQKDAEGGLTKRDLQAVRDVISDLVAFSETKEGKAVINHVVLALNADDIYKAIATPCASLVERMHAIRMESFLKPILEKAQISEADFIGKCDRTTRAYRVAHSSPEMGLYILKLKRKLKNDPTHPEAPVWEALVNMFTVSAADVQSVLPEKDVWQKLFNQQRPLLLGTPFILDF